MLRRKARIFISSTIKSEWNHEYNRRLCACLESAGFHCFLPQRDVKAETATTVFRQNVEAIRDSDAVLAVVKNENANLGVELGFTFGINKPIIILCEGHGRLPSMLAGVGTEIVRVADLGSVDSYIEELILLLS